MPLVHALMQNRAGIARAGATRAAYFIPNLVVTINGTPRTTAIERGSVRVGLNMNGAGDVATFTVNPHTGVVPTEGQTVVIGTGTSVNRAFGGQITRTRHRRLRGGDDPYIDVECQDWRGLFDRRVVVESYAGLSASAIALAIVTTYTSGFTTFNIVPGLPTVDFFPPALDYPSQALRRLATLVGGGFYIDAGQDVHLFGLAGETGAKAPTAPLALTSTRTTLRSFSHTKDRTQLRTRDLVETKGSQTTADVAVGQRAIPVEDASNFIPPVPLLALEVGVLTINLQIPSASFAATTVKTAAAVGATTLEVTDLSLIVSLGVALPGYVRIGQRWIYYTAGTVTSAPAGNLTGIPVSGAGSIQTPVAALEIVECRPMLGLPTGVPRAIPQGTYLSPLTTVEAGAAQTAQAAIEGGDGIHEYVLSDRRYDVANASGLGTADVNAFSAPLVSAAWETADQNARPGCQQAIAFAGTDPISATLTITHVDLDFPYANQPPRRQCQASTVRLATRADVFALNGAV